MVSFVVALHCYTLINLNLHFLVIPYIYGFRPWWPWEKRSKDLKFSSVQSLSRIWHFETPWTAARQASLSIANPWSLLKCTSIESLMPSNHLILCRPLLPPSIFPSIRVFSNESDGQKINEKIFNSANYFRNANQNYSEVSSHTFYAEQRQFLKKWGNIK